MIEEGLAPSAKPVNLRMDIELHGRAKKLVRQELACGMESSMSSLIRRALEAYLDGYDEALLHEKLRTELT